MFYVYVLRSNKNGRRYIGSCQNIADRVRQHNNGVSKDPPRNSGALSTLKPFQLVQKPCERSDILRLAVVEMN